MRERIEAAESEPLASMSPERRRSLYHDLSLRVEVGSDREPHISGLFPVRVGEYPMTLVQTPSERSYLYEPVSKKDTSRTWGGRGTTRA